MILSLFPGIDILGMGFEQEGYTVVRGPDLIFGGDVTNFRGEVNLFEGIIGGPPCQNFSGTNRSRDEETGWELVDQFLRIVQECDVEWFLMENVCGIPTVQVDGWSVQNFIIDCREVGNKQSRKRKIQFGSKKNDVISVDRIEIRRDDDFVAAVLSSEWKRSSRRKAEDICELQGLDKDFYLGLHGFSLRGIYEAIGNAVPLDLAKALAIAVRGRHQKSSIECRCGCGRIVVGRTPDACRKRISRLGLLSV